MPRLDAEWLAREATRAFRAFNDHTRACPDCDPVGNSLCFIGDGLNDEVSRQAAARIRAELRESDAQA